MFHHLKNEKGVSIILIVFSVVLLFGFGAIAIDIAHLYNVKNQLQVAADAAALAGAAEVSDPTDTTQTKARKAAFRIAARNVADVAEQDVPPCKPFGDGGVCTTGAQAGSAIPVALDPDADVTVGNWDDKTSTFSDNKTPVNAVKVVARRTSSGSYATYQPQVRNWFSKIFSMLPGGVGFNVSNISATAIAALSPLKVLPIAVNEYWYTEYVLQHPGDGAYADNVHLYPSSFVRQKEVAPNGVAQTVDSPAFGYTFALLGGYANSNQGSADPNGYLALDWRSDYYLGGPLKTNEKGNLYVDPQLYTAKDGTGGCSSCSSYFNPSSTDPFDNNEKNKTGVEYLVKGYPDTRLIPTAIYEISRPGNTNQEKLDAYSNKNSYFKKGFEVITSVYNDRYNQKSECPHAVVHYFRTSSTDPLNYSLAGDPKVVADYYPAGSRFMALVYDGTHTGGNGNEPNGTVDKLVTIVGYVPIEIDGYENKNPKNLGLQAGNGDDAYKHNKSVLKPSWDSVGNPNTMYGHALSDIIQPDPTSMKGGCDFVTKVNDARYRYSYPRLVGPSVRYGLAD